MGHFDFKGIFYKLPYFFYPGISKLHNLSCFSINEMVMFFEFVRSFELSAIVAELMLGYQTAIQKQFNGIVQGSAADPVFVVLHTDIKRFNVEMAIRIIDLFENGKPLGSLSVPALFQVVSEDFLNCFE